MRRAIVLISFTIFGAGATAADVPPLSLPLACVPGEDCFIQKYVDVDPTQGIADYTCGSLSSDTHKGTDFRVLPGADVDVLAAAAGTVRAVRDGMADNRFAEGVDVPPERACGNGVLIDHGGGVETLSCHLSPGTLTVAEGSRVAAGDVLGKVGASGLAAFRHVHLQVMADGKVLDPFTGLAQEEARCGEAGAPLWSEEAAEALRNTPRTAVLAAGFSDGPVTLPAIQDQTLPATIAAGAGALVVYGLAMGAEEGDRHRLTLKGPGVDMDNEVGQERDQAQAMRFIGKRFPGGLPPGLYTMRYELRRGASVVDAAEHTLAVETR